MRAYLYTDMPFKRAAVSTACFYLPGYIEGVFAYGLRVCRICIELQLSMCKALEMDEIREVFCMCHELLF